MEGEGASGNAGKRHVQGTLIGHKHTTISGLSMLEHLKNYASKCWLVLCMCRMRYIRSWTLYRKIPGKNSSRDEACRCTDSCSCRRNWQCARLWTGNGLDHGLGMG